MLSFFLGQPSCFVINPRRSFAVKQTVILSTSLFALLLFSAAAFGQSTPTTAQVDTKNSGTVGRTGRPAAGTTVEVIKDDINEALIVIESSHVEGKALNY